MIKKSVARISLAIPAFLMAQSASVAAYEIQHDAHQHGAGEVNIVLEGKAISAEMRFPMNDIVGFEHAPNSKSDHAAYLLAEQKFENADSMLMFTEAAHCSLITSQVSLGDAEEHKHDHDEHGHEEHKHAEHDHHEHGHEEHKHAEHDHHEHGHEERKHAEHDHHEHEHEEHKHAEHDHHEHEHDEHAHDAEHSDAEVLYAWRCEHPEKISGINFGLFKQFPSLETVQARVITAKGAQLNEMSAAKSKLRLK